MRFGKAQHFKRLDNSVQALLLAIPLITAGCISSTEDTDEHDTTDTGTGIGNETETPDAAVASDSDSATDLGADTDTDTGSISVSETDTGSDAGVEIDTGSDSNVETDTGSDAGVEIDTGSDSNVETDTGSDAGIDTDKETDTDTDTDTNDYDYGDYFFEYEMVNDYYVIAYSAQTRESTFLLLTVGEVTERTSDAAKGSPIWDEVLMHGSSSDIATAWRLRIGGAECTIDVSREMVEQWGGFAYDQCGDATNIAFRFLPVN